LGITIDSSLSWKNHVDELTVKLSKACYAVRFLRPFMSHESMRMIYYSYFHTVMSYGIIFWGNSAHSINTFKLQKMIIRIIIHSRNRDSCRHMFMKLDILPFYSQYLFSLLIFVIRSYIKLTPEILTIFIFYSQGWQYIETVFIIWVLSHLITYLII
jgi:hypothetical protein